MTREIDDTEAEWLDPGELIELDADEGQDHERDEDDEATTRRISGIRAKREELRERAEEALRLIREEALAEIAIPNIPSEIKPEFLPELLPKAPLELTPRDTPPSAGGSERALELGAAETPAAPLELGAAPQTAPITHAWYRPLLLWIAGALRLAVFFMIGVAIGSLVAMALVELLGPRAPRGELHQQQSDLAQESSASGQREALKSERGALPDIGKPSDPL